MARMTQTVDDALLAIQHRASLLRTLGMKTDSRLQPAMLEMCNDIEALSERARRALGAVARLTDVPDE
jgi:hypothetical protein